MSTYQSVQSATVDNSGTLVITKPVSLAVGDFLLAGIWTDRDGGTSATLSTPAGWTLEELIDGGSGNAALGVFSKVADSADVAASNFTFTATGSPSQQHVIGHLLRITNFGNRSGETSGAIASTSTTVTMTGFTPSPAIAEALYVVFAGRSFSSAPGNVTSVAMATSDPTWTERAESTVNGNTTDSTFAVYTANRTQTTTTGTFTTTFATSDNTRTASYAIALNPRINGSVTPSTQINAYALSPIPKTEIDAIVDAPTTRIGRFTSWQNDSKPSTNWTNDTI
jgi:hypothetical protein